MKSLNRLASIRSEYNELALEANQILEGLNIKDKHGKILEHGHAVIYKIRQKLKANDDLTESIEIVGKDKWLKLTDIWKSLRDLESEERNILSPSEYH